MISEICTLCECRCSEIKHTALNKTQTETALWLWREGQLGRQEFYTVFTGQTSYRQRYRSAHRALNLQEEPGAVTVCSSLVMCLYLTL